LRLRELGYHSAMPETFLSPQPFNVLIEPEEDIAPPVRMPVIAPSVPVVAQEITPDVDLYPRRRHGVVRRR
jgi:hypothetical protein